MSNLGKIVVIDLEATCWEGAPPAGEESEIIEVGVALLTTSTLEISKPRRIFVWPTKSTVSEFCTNLTGITQQVLLEKGKTRDQLAEILLDEYKLGERAWAGWGDDRDDLVRYLGMHGNRLSSTYLNIAALFSLSVDQGRRIGLVDAITMAGEQFKGDHHRGGDDAYNAAVVLRHILTRLRSGFAVLPKP